MRAALHDTIATRQFLLLHDPEASAEQIQDVLNWMDLSPENSEAIDQLDRFWKACDDLPDVHRIALRRDRARSIPTFRRAALVPCLAAAAVLVLCLSIVTLTNGWMSRVPAVSTALTLARYESAIGQTREIVLPDRSVVTLAGASAISIRFDGQTRRVALTDGEALFHVAKNPARPFIVDTGSGYVRAIGTIFDVQRALDRTTVSVSQGLVRVGARNARGAVRSANLPAGMQLSYRANGSLDPPNSIDPKDVGMWRFGRLNFVDRPLGFVIADINRYSVRPIVIDDPAIAEIAVTGAVRIDQVDEWLRGLASVSNLTLASDNLQVIRLSVRHGHKHIMAPDR